MRIVIVNHCHPDCPHVCGTRAREFAAALARLGHRVVLLTETLRREDPGPDPVVLPTALATHDWALPFRLAVRPKAAPVLEAIRAGRLSAPLRAVVIAWQYLARGGMFTDWRDASRPYWQPVVSSFQPDVVWGIFGNTDAWAIAQGIARDAGCPWVRDVKDQWTAFIPSPFRALLARRFGDAGAMTALSGANAGNAAPWFPGGAQVVYSGVSEALVGNSSRPPADGYFRLVLVGALYDRKALSVMVDGLGRFAETADRGNVELVYAGTDTAAAADALKPLASRFRIDIRGQMPFAAYWTLITGANANLYIRNASKGWWHHKIVELLAARHAILCVHGEIEEARHLAHAVGGRLHEADDASSVAAVLDGLWRSRDGQGSDPDALRLLTWDAQAKTLDSVLQRASAR